MPEGAAGRRGGGSFDQQEARAIAEFSRHFGITFRDPALLRLALTHRSYLSVTGMGPGDSNERLEFLGDSVLGLVTSEYLYRQSPDEHEGQLTKTKSLLVSRAILSRRALAMGLGRFVLMSHSEVESGGRQRLSILADAFESVLGAVYLDQGFEVAREFVERWLLRGSREIVADKRHRNYKSHLQEYVQSTFRTHPVYRIRSQMGPDHSKLFQVEVMVGRRVLGEGRGNNKKEAEQAAARAALEGVERPGRSRGEAQDAREPRGERDARPQNEARVAVPESTPDAPGRDREDRPGRRGARGRRGRGRGGAPGSTDPARDRPAPAREPDIARPARPAEAEPPPSVYDEDDIEEVGRPEGPLEERHVDPFGIGASEWTDEAEPARPEPEEGGWDDAAAPSEAELPEAPAGEPDDSGFDDRVPGDLAFEPEAGSEVRTDEDAADPGSATTRGGSGSEPRYGRRRARRR